MAPLFLYPAPHQRDTGRVSVELHMATAEDALLSNDTRLVDVVDGLLRHGVVLRGELWLTVADVELVFLGVDLLLTTPEKMKKQGSSA